MSTAKLPESMYGLFGAAVGFHCVIYAVFNVSREKHFARQMLYFIELKFNSTADSGVHVYEERASGGSSEGRFGMYEAVWSM